jgi:hypothetical protein
VRILLLRPYPETAQFGLSPFFQTEPLGLMYLAAALRQAGHSVQLADMRFERRGIAEILRESRPDLSRHLLPAYPRGVGVVATCR